MIRHSKRHKCNISIRTNDRNVITWALEKVAWQTFFFCSFTEIGFGNTEEWGRTKKKTTEKIDDDDDEKCFASQHFFDCVFVHSWSVCSYSIGVYWYLVHLDFHTRWTGALVQSYLMLNLFAQHSSDFGRCWCLEKEKRTQTWCEKTEPVQVHRWNGEIMKKHFGWNRLNLE